MFFVISNSKYIIRFLEIFPGGNVHFAALATVATTEPKYISNCYEAVSTTINNKVRNALKKNKFSPEIFFHSGKMSSASFRVMLA